jgi:predicted DNA-binding transcriptional regulator AlpA
VYVARECFDRRNDTKVPHDRTAGGSGCATNRFPQPVFRVGIRMVGWMHRDRVRQGLAALA